MTNEARWPRRQDSAVTAAVGVTKAQLFFQATARWLFREQPLEDYGIDAHVEVVESGDVKGRLVALQIKSGDSWLTRSATGGWTFYPESKHVAYWQNHSLPVAIVVWHESTDTLFFREASRHTLEKTKSGGWKLHFKDSDQLNRSALPVLLRLSEGTAYNLRLRELGLLLPWMERISQGQRLILNADEWINKTWGKGDLEIVAVTQDGRTELLGKWMVALGSEPYERVLPPLFEWADLVINPDIEHKMDSEFEGYPYEVIHPYLNMGDEVHRWSLELKLNMLGRAFLVLDEYAGDVRHRRPLTPLQ